MEMETGHETENTEQKRLIADGDYQQLALHQGDNQPLPLLNISHPEAVEAAHRAYMLAGADLIRTNTRGADALTLARYGLEDRCEAINNSGAAHARAALGPDGLMAGTIGPIGGGESTGYSRSEKERAYSQQMIYLSDTGVTFLLLEHFTDPQEAELATSIASRCSDAPVLAQIKLPPPGAAFHLESLTDTAKRLADAGAQALGISCAPLDAQPEKVLEILLATGLPVSLMTAVADRKPETLHQFRTLHQVLFPEPIAIRGGCCGTTPDFIAQLKNQKQTPGR